MRERDLKEELKKGDIRNKYFIASSEPLLIDNLVKSIKEHLNINEAFDYEIFSINDCSIEDIVAKLFLTPFASKYRLIVVKTLEEIDFRSLPATVHPIKDLQFPNILIMTYRNEKNNRDSIKRLSRIFTDFTLIDIDAEQPDIEKWIKAKVKRDGIDLPLDLQHYLEDEFSNDITGLKNEFDKIENYLHEASTLNSQILKDLAKGLTEINKYRVAKHFFSGDEKTLAHYQEIAPYLESEAIIIYSMSRNLLFSAIEQRFGLHMNQKRIKSLLKQMIFIDKKIKNGSYFSNLMLEMLFLQNTSFYKKGVSHGE